MTESARKDKIVIKLINANDIRLIRELLIEVLLNHPSLMSQLQKERLYHEDDPKLTEFNLMEFVDGSDDKEVYNMRAKIRGQYYAD